MSLLKVIKGVLKHSRKDVDWLTDSSEQIRGKAAFNAGLQVVLNFLEGYENGNVDKEFTDEMIKLSEEK